MAKLTKQDLNFVLSRVPRDVRELVKTKALFIAGGFIRSTIAGEKPSDVDLFGPSKEALKMVATEFALKRQARLHETDNAFTILSGHRIPIQFIHRWTYGVGEEARLISEFDFTIAQAVIWAVEVKVAGKSEWRWESLASDSFYSDLAARRLVYTYPKRDEDAGGSLLRALKFVKRGYSIQAASLAGVVARLLGAVRKIDKVYDSEDWATTVILGLLREVDPLIVVDGVDLVDEHEAAS